MTNFAELPQAEASYVLEQAFLHLKDWPMRSTEAFRNVILGQGTTMFGVSPILPYKDFEQVLFMKEVIAQTVAEGRMIDFGFIPNDIIKAESLRSRYLFETHELIHPYPTWLAVTSWEGGFNGYHISPHPDRPGETLVLELYGVSMPFGLDVVIVYDVVSINAAGIDNTLVSPVRTSIPETEKSARDRGANSLDPMVTMLRLLADASIPITRVEAPHKLNAKRIKFGKPPIPEHTVVDTRDYVASFRASSHVSRGSKGGTHASPIAHWRRSHLRHLADGRNVTVRASKVNWRSTEELHRLFYKI